MRSGLTLFEIQMAANLPDLEIFLQILNFFNGKKYFWFFFHTMGVGWVAFEKYGKFHVFSKVSLSTMETYKLELFSIIKYCDNNQSPQSK